jgi:heat shock protein HtpX
LDAVSGFLAPYVTVLAAASAASVLRLAGLKFTSERSYRLRAWVVLAPLADSLILALQIYPACFAHWLSMSSWDTVHLICQDPSYAYVRSVCTSWVALISASFLSAGASGVLGYNLGGWMVRAVYGCRRVSGDELGELHPCISEMARGAGIRAPDIYLIESSRPTIFSHGGRGGPSVFVSVGLLETLTRDEVLASVGHEVAHIKNRDTLWRSVASSLKLASLFNLAGFLLEPVLARDLEFLADEEGARLSGRRHALVSALVKMSQATPRGLDGALLGVLSLSPFAARGGRWRLFSSHPPVEERVRRLLELD